VIRFDALIFDFDGVLVDSVEVKTQAFASLYASYGPEIVAQVVAYHLANGGMSRHRKFRYFHETLLGVSLSPEEEARLADEFSLLVEEAVVAAPWVAGAREFLFVHQALLPLFVASGTPDEELKRILKKRNMMPLFQGVYGSPAEKGEILRSIVTHGNFDPTRVLMIGDAWADWEGALAANISFLGCIPSHNNPFPPEVPVISDLTSLAAFIHGT